MRITFVSNYINHHQLPLCMALMEENEVDFTFLQTEPMTEERKNMGWDESLSKLSFVKLYYEDTEGSKALIMDSDVVIFGGAEDESLIIPRLEKGKFTIRYSERIYKEGRYKFVSPRGLIRKYKDHTRFRKSPVYLLCAGAYTAGDFKLVGAYKNKALEFGYFPKVIEYSDLNELRKDNECVNLLWVSRYIDWKHPYMPVNLAKRLKKEGKSFHLTMVGRGEMLKEVEEYAKASELLSVITFIESKSPDEVRTLMRKADIFLLTSDMKEGWGAVINEAMNSGCAVVCSHETGAAPSLINHNINGKMFISKDEESLYRQVLSLLDDKALRYELGSKAYKTMTTSWNAKEASKRLISFIKDDNHEIKKYDDMGPLSPAKNLSFAKVKKGIRN